MSPRPRRLLPPAAGRSPVERIEMEQFARRLHTAMTAKGLTNSDLARLVWGETTDKKGYTVARNRDRISVYLRAEALPEPATLEKIAAALGLTKEDLAPELAAAAIDREKPELAMTMVAGHPDKVHLQINVLIPLSVATQIIALLNEAKQPQQPPAPAGNGTSGSAQ